MEFHSSQGDLPRVPDDLTIPQFFLDVEHWHELRPAWPQGAPWVIADKSGEGRGVEEVCGSFRYLFIQSNSNRKGGGIYFSCRRERGHLPPACTIDSR